MTSLDTIPDSSNRPPDAGSRWFNVVLAGVVASWLLSLAIAHAPAPARKLFVVPLVCGGLIGAVIAVVAGSGVSRRGAIVWSIICTVAALAHLAWLGTNELQQAAATHLQSHPKELLALEFLKQSVVSDPTLVAHYDEQRRRLSPTFQDYLAWRFKPLHAEQSPWPSLLWGLELLLGAIAATVVIWRLRPPAEKDGLGLRVEG